MDLQKFRKFGRFFGLFNDTHDGNSVFFEVEYIKCTPELLKDVFIHKDINNYICPDFSKVPDKMMFLKNSYEGSDETLTFELFFEGCKRDCASSQELDFLGQNTWVYYENPDTLLEQDNLNQLIPKYHGYKYSIDPNFYNYHKIFDKGQKLIGAQLLEVKTISNRLNIFQKKYYDYINLRSV